MANGDDWNRYDLYGSLVAAFVVRVKFRVFYGTYGV
jgi:hypothetical protein